MQWLRSSATRRDFERFVAERTDPLLRTAFLVAGDAAEAEDLVQETLFRVARRWPRVAAMESPEVCPQGPAQPGAARQPPPFPPLHRTRGDRCCLCFPATLRHTHSFPQCLLSRRRRTVVRLGQQ